MFVARQEQGRLDSTSRHAFPRATLDALDVAAEGAAGPLDALIARVRTTGTLVTVIPDLNELGTSTQIAAAGRPRCALGDRMSDRHRDGHRRRARVLLRDAAER